MQDQLNGARCVCRSLLNGSGTEDCLSVGAHIKPYPKGDTFLSQIRISSTHVMVVVHSSEIKVYAIPELYTKHGPHVGT